MSRFLKFNFILNVLLNIISAFSLSKNSLYPYSGIGTQYLQTDSNNQLLSMEIQLKTPIAFYDKLFNRIFINGNGVLSFMRSMQRFFNIAFPLDDPVIAPLYTHVDTTGSGKVYYSETNNSDIVIRAGEVVRSAFNNTNNFIPQHVLLVTWDDVGYFDRKSDKVNTYQVAISSNGTHSFVELLYPQNGIQWIQSESHPNGLPDAKAQAGFMSEGKIYTLKGSGSDQIRNIDKWSNINRPGQWIFQVGPIIEGKNIRSPDNIEKNNQLSDQKCHVGGTTCHSKASCVDYEYGYCCSCKSGYFGNGKACQPNDLPIRVIGRIVGKINDVEFSSRDLQCYVQTKDGRTYTALSRIPENVGQSFQLLSILGEIIGWLFAKPVGNVENGYQLTGGLFNHTAELVYTDTGDRVLIQSNYLGLDVFGQLKMEATLQGFLPKLPIDAKIDHGDYEEIYTHSQRGMIRSHNNRNYKLDGDIKEYVFTLDQVITYKDCIYGPLPYTEETTKLKFSRGLTSYEGHEAILRFAMNSKVVSLEEKDLCVQGIATCGNYSSCVVEGDEFRCVCNAGYQKLYEENGTSNCVDIDECTAGYHVCSPEAQCINNDGGHVCHCKPGYSGDGKICEKTTTCDSPCDMYEECSVINDIPTCTCITGFTNNGPGTSCYPIDDPCDLANNCSPQGSCIYDTDKQTHKCVCKSGLIGDGYNCYMDSEVTSEQSPIPTCNNNICWCPTNWEFQNNICIRGGTQKSKTFLSVSSDKLDAEPLPECLKDSCICPWRYQYIQMNKTCIPLPGFNSDTMGPSGLKYTCSDHSDCINNASCSYNPIKSRYECTCNPGFFDPGDGQCIVGNCSIDPTICHINAHCVAKKDVYTCTCIDGFHGDGFIQCIENQSSCNIVDICGPNAECGYNHTSRNFMCVCLQGYFGNGISCIPQASCKQDPTQCSSDAECVAVNDNDFSCVCKDGFVGNGLTCKLKPLYDANFLLVNQGMATLKIPYFPLDGNHGSPIHLTYTQMAIAIDFDCSTGIAYLSDITGNKITSLSYNGATAETFITGVSSPEGITIDWVSQTIFWTDSGKGTVEVAHLETKKRKVLFSDGLVNPRGITVHPYRGKIFWSDWNRAMPKIEWANEDGSGRDIFLQGDSVKLPNSLSMDWATDELCWTDAGTSTISCITIDSHIIRIVAKDLLYPFGLAISAHNYYFTDWKTHKIEVVSKSTGDREMSIPIPPGGSGKLYGVVAVPESCPSLSNICEYENGRCHTDQICLPDGRGERTCACADDSAGSCNESRYTA